MKSTISTPFGAKPSRNTATRSSTFAPSADIWPRPFRLGHVQAANNGNKRRRVPPRPASRKSESLDEILHADPNGENTNPDRCTNPKGHEFACTGTAYGGGDERFHDDGRCYCIHCDADGNA